MLKICKYCENEFEPSHKKNTCCSAACGRKLFKKWPKPKEIGNKKYCPKCKRILDLDMFYMNNHITHRRLTSWCKECNRKHVNKSTRDYKKEIIEYMGGKCNICGYNKCIHALDIHHISPDKKDPNFKRLRRVLRDNLKKELEGCILVCSNCHREIHTQDSIIE